VTLSKQINTVIYTNWNR